jgi:signal transduction histidine kinase
MRRILSFFPLSIRGKLSALAVFLILTLVFSGFYLQSVLNENAKMTKRQSEIIHALSDISTANVEFSRIRWAYLSFLSQPNSRTGQAAEENLQILTDNLSSLEGLPLDEEVADLQSHISTLGTIAATLKEKNKPKAAKVEDLTQDAMMALGAIEKNLTSMGQTLESMLSEKSAETLQKTRGMRVIPLMFILGGLITVCISMAIIIVDVLSPMSKITNAMAAASTDTENASKYILPIDRNDEVGKITQTLNQLLEQVSSGIEKMLQAETMLNHAQRMEMVGQMSGGIAHDFNNMLIVISGNLELIERRVPDNPQLKEMIQAALASVEKGKELTQRILVFSRKQILKPEAVNVNREMPGIIDMIRRVVRDDIVIEADLANDLFNIYVDQPQLENALLNLAVNARDAMPGNDGKITLRTRNISISGKTALGHSSMAAGDYALISMKDNGSGISPDIIDRIFDPFFTTKDPGKGTGLGLSMVYGFTHQSGGYVTIDSTPGEGTTINLFFPKTLYSIDEMADDFDDIDAGISSGHEESLMVVDDREDVLKYLSTSLRELGYKVTTAKNAGAALNKLQNRRKLDLLITDVVMPGGMNGEMLAEEVKKTFPQTKVLYISGYTRDALIDQGALKTGVNLLTKPFTTAELAREVRNLLDTRH